MDNLPTQSSAILRDRGFSASHAGNHGAPARPGIEKTGSRDGNRQPEEGHPPANLPKAFESMLKTTTETGDIGIFSLKPSRVSPPVKDPRRLGNYNENGPLKQSQQAFQPYGVPSIDDRRRLPSYARDPASEFISMYETPSQKSSRVFDDTVDYRSYSMTHATRASYTLSNHRSYTSLRSQPNAGGGSDSGFLQRPRSPFAYPTRLRRPGFRPSSPALTDGGGVDYRRRAEIDRLPYGPGHSTSSPSSLYAQKRKPPMLRSEGNRSTPSLLSQPSPPRRCSSPLAMNSGNTGGNTGGDWPRRIGPASVNTSPARSTFSLSSTVNLCTNNLPPSNTSTPGKTRPPIPLYYDYTEDFDVEEYSQPSIREPPPHFRTAQTIPEDRPICSDGLSLVDPNARGFLPSLNNGVRISSSSASIHHIPLQESQESNISNSSFVGWPTRKASLAIASKPEKQSSSGSSSESSSNVGSLKDEAQEVTKYAETLVNLTPRGQGPPHRTIGEYDLEEPSDHEQLDTSQVMECNVEKTDKLQLTKTSQKEHNGREGTAIQQKPGKVAHATFPPPSSNRKTSPRPDRSSSLNFDAGKKRARSSLNTIDTGLTDLAELLSSLESANESRSEYTNVGPLIAPERIIMDSPTIPQELIDRTKPPVFGPVLPVSTFNPQQVPVQASSHKPRQKWHRRHRTQHIETVIVQGVNDRKDWSPDIPRKSVSRSGSPMLAPKPISPARQLKLKNSVPHLMKALPPLPSHLLRLYDSPSAGANSAPMPPKPPHDIESTASKILQLPPKVFQPNRTHGNDTSDTLMNIPESKEVFLTTRSFDSAISETGEVSIATPPKLKLKMRASAGVLPPSSHDSRPWNLEDNYPWSETNPNLRLPSMIGDVPGDLKPTKFKLKTSRISNSTSNDTVRINRRSCDSKSVTGIRLSSVKDLFSPPSGLDIFHRHVNSRESSENSSQVRRESSSTPGNSSNAPNKSTVQTSHLGDEPYSPAVSHVGFLDDTSHAHGHRNLRKRISNLKARLTAPYSSKGGSRSCDDITLNTLSRTNGYEPPAIRSVPNLHGSIGLSVEVEDTTYQTDCAKRIRLKDKLSKWLKGARMAISARVRALSTSK